MNLHFEERVDGRDNLEILGFFFSFLVCARVLGFCFLNSGEVPFLILAKLPHAPM